MPHSQANPRANVVLLDDPLRRCRVTLASDYLSTLQADALFAKLAAETPFQTEAPVMFGRPVVVRRRTYAYGDPGVSYRYSGLVRQAVLWSAELLPLVKELRAHTGAPFNFALCQLYPDGDAGLGWHADDESDLVPEAPIASVSLGAARDFVMRLGRRGPATVKVSLGHGSLLVMEGATQRHYQHAVPKRAACHAPRINLTFRVIREAVPRRAGASR